MGEPIDLAAARAGKGERVATSVEFTGNPFDPGPWALIDPGTGLTLALGFGPVTYGATLALVSLAGLATQVATPERVQQVLAEAHAKTAAHLPADAVPEDWQAPGT